MTSATPHIFDAHTSPERELVEASVAYGNQGANDRQQQLMLPWRSLLFSMVAKVVAGGSERPVTGADPCCEWDGGYIGQGKVEGGEGEKIMVSDASLACSSSLSLKDSLNKA